MSCHSNFDIRFPPSQTSVGVNFAVRGASSSASDIGRIFQLFYSVSHLAALDVVVQIVAEHVQQVDGVVPRRLAGVPREQHCRRNTTYITHSRIN